MVAAFIGEQWLSDPQSTKVRNRVLEVTHRKCELGLLDRVSVEGHIYLYTQESKEVPV